MPCKHIGALCYALEEFSRLRKLPEFLTCTEKLQEWNRPRPKKLAIIPVADLAARRSDILLREGKGSSLSTFDPRQPHQRTFDTAAVETLRCDLLSLNQPCAFLDILVPPLDKITHDHTYSLPSGEEEMEMTSELAEPSELETDVLHCTTSDNLKAVCAEIKSTLNVSLVERERIERDTKKQCSQKEWHILRSKRITGSKCGRILCQKRRSTSLLMQCLYPKPLDPPPPPIAWGRHYESVALQKYIAHMNDTGHKLTVEECGFIIHPTQGWLGASPDGRVTDTSTELPHGIVEIKCPYSKCEMTPEEACSDSLFCCELVDAGIRLKATHMYFHQVQLQLYVGADEYHWCDFCIFTCKGISVQRIKPDHDWQKKHIPELESYFDDYILPELASPQHKPSYYL